MLTNKEIEKCCGLVGWEYNEMNDTSLTHIKKCSRVVYLNNYENESLWLSAYYPLLLTLTIEAIEDNEDYSFMSYKNKEGGIDITTLHSGKIIASTKHGHYKTHLKAKECFLHNCYFQRQELIDPTEAIKQATIDKLKDIIKDLEAKK